MSSVVGKAIAWARQRRGLNLGEFADLLGVHRSWVFRLERGLNDPKFETVRKAAEICQMSFDEMLLGQLPDRISTLNAAAKKSLQKKFPQDFDLVSKGKRPSDEFVSDVAKVLRMTPDDVCYGLC